MLLKMSRLNYNKHIALITKKTNNLKLINRFIKQVFVINTDAVNTISRIKIVLPTSPSLIRSAIIASFYKNMS